MAAQIFDHGQLQAGQKLDRIQHRGRATRMKLCGVPVDVRPMDGNMFRINLDMALDGSDKAARRLNDIGADITRPFMGIVTADVTWDSTLHYLAMTGDLV